MVKFAVYNIIILLSKNRFLQSKREINNIHKISKI